MIIIEKLINSLEKNYCEFYTGVPDSILKEFSNHLKNKNHIINIFDPYVKSIVVNNQLYKVKLL